LDIFPKNDVISFFRKRFCALGLWLRLRLRLRLGLELGLGLGLGLKLGLKLAKIRFSAYNF